LASLLGIKPESLSRVFAGLSNYGVQVDGNNITIADFRVLEDLSQYDYDLENE
jgi:CRP/FNR family transcriptional activator FtrB